MEKYSIVRGDRSGVFFGKIESRNGQEVTLRDVRRLWYWDGAASISELAVKGPSRPQNCKFPVPVDKIVLTDVIEIDECTQEAVKAIKEVPLWVG